MSASASSGASGPSGRSISSPWRPAASSGASKYAGERAEAERDEHGAARRAAQQLGDPVRRRPLEVVEHDHRRLDDETDLLVAEGVRAAPGEHAVAMFAGQLGQLLQQSRLADSGLAVDRDERRAERTNRLRDHPALMRAAGEGCQRPTRAADPSPRGR